MFKPYSSLLQDYGSVVPNIAHVGKLIENSVVVDNQNFLTLKYIGVSLSMKFIVVIMSL